MASFFWPVELRCSEDISLPVNTERWMEIRHSWESVLRAEEQLISSHYTLRLNDQNLSCRGGAAAG